MKFHCLWSGWKRDRGFFPGVDGAGEKAEASAKVCARDVCSSCIAVTGEGSRAREESYKQTVIKTYRGPTAHQPHSLKP